MPFGLVTGIKHTRLIELMNLAVDLSAGFLTAIITDPAVLQTNNAIGMIIRIRYRIELIIQHES